MYVIQTDDNSNQRPPAALSLYIAHPPPGARAADEAALTMAAAALQAFVHRYVTNSEDLEFLVLYLDSLGVHTLEELNRIPESAWETLSSWLTPGTAPALRNELAAMTHGPSRSSASSPPLPSSPPGPKQAPISALSLQSARAVPKAESVAAASESDLGKSAAKKDAKGDRTRNDSMGSPPPGAGSAQTRPASRSSEGAIIPPHLSPSTRTHRHLSFPNALL